MCTTNPELERMPSGRLSSGTRQTWNEQWKRVIQLSKMIGSLSCCAMTQTVGDKFPSLEDEASACLSMQASTQVWARGSMRDSLYMQSHAMTRSKLLA